MLTSEGEHDGLRVYRVADCVRKRSVISSRAPTMVWEHQHLGVKVVTLLEQFLKSQPVQVARQESDWLIFEPDPHDHTERIRSQRLPFKPAAYA